MPKEARVFFGNQMDVAISQFGRVGDFKDSQVGFLNSNVLDVKMSTSTFFR